MAPKKAATASKAKASNAHGSYMDMIKTAIVTLKERSGSSRQAIKKYILANNKPEGTEKQLSTRINFAINRGVETGEFEQPKGSSGPVKLMKKGAAAPAPKTEAKEPKAAKTSTTKKTTTTKKPAASTTKKAPATKKPSATKSTAKKPATASTTKANTAKPRKAPAKKTPAAAPAVAAEKPVVLGKTKSGRVTKSTAPKEVKKALAPKKKAAPQKKSATPKKAA